MKAKIDCPFCYSGNYFDFDRGDSSVNCDDCGFELIEKESLKLIESRTAGNCYFCNYDRFFYDTSWLGLFKSNTIVCYLCEAEYRDWQLVDVDDSFNPASAVIAKKSKQGLDLKNRVDLSD